MSKKRRIWSKRAVEKAEREFAKNKGEVEAGMPARSRQVTSTVASEMTMRRQHEIRAEAAKQPRS